MATEVIHRASEGYRTGNARIKLLPLGKRKKASFVRGVSVARLSFSALTGRPPKQSTYRARGQLMATLWGGSRALRCLEVSLILKGQATEADPHFAPRVRTVLDVHRILGKREDLRRRLASLIRTEDRQTLAAKPGWMREFLTSLEDLGLRLDD